MIRDGVLYQQAEGDGVWQVVGPKLKGKCGFVESEIDSSVGGH